MILWIDAHLSPSLGPWMRQQFGIDARPVRDLGLLHAVDQRIFLAARTANAVVLTKDRDFVNLLARLGPPPAILWVTCGNTSNARLQEILKTAFPQAVTLLQSGESLVEISDAR